MTIVYKWIPTKYCDVCTLFAFRHISLSGEILHTLEFPDLEYSDHSPEKRVIVSP